MAKKQTGRYSRKKESEELDRSYKSIAAKKAGKRKPSKTSRTTAVVTVCITLIVIAACLLIGCIYLANNDLDGIILSNVSVAGVDVGGLSQAEAIEAVEAATKDTFTKLPMVVTVLDSSIELPADYCGGFDVRGAVKAAYRYGNSGSGSKRENEQKTAMESGYCVDIIPYLDLDTNAIKAALAKLGENYCTTLTQSTYNIIGSAPAQTLVVTLGTPEYGLDLNKLYDTVLGAYNQNRFTAEGKCGMLQPDPIDLEAILNEHYKAPTDAHFDTATFEVIDGVEGYGFDLESAATALQQAKPGSTVEIPFAAIPPAVTAADLSGTLYRDTLASYTAHHLSESGRDTNLRLACEAINGTILYPGDVFSYNEALGERTSAKGYQLGPSYTGNSTVYTLGGGICQVSSSLYYCAMVADLEILVRDHHGFATSYMPLGMDATVSWGSIDFRFRNNSEYPIRINASASGGSVTVELLGTDTKDYYIKLEYDVLSTDHYETTYKTMSSSNPDGYRDGDTIVEPYTGYDVKTYRCKYSKEDDSLISKDYEAASYYRRRDAVICKIEDTTAIIPGNDQQQGIGNGGVTDSGSLPELP